MIVVNNLWKRYGKLQVLKGLNLQVLDGETVIILGRSGVGKSVLLRQIIGIEKPDEGYVEVNGIRVTSINLQSNFEVMRHMGMLFQSAALFDSMNIGDNVGFYLKQHFPDMPPGENRDRITHALEVVGLAGTEDKMPSDLSGGMRKRAALARVIVYRPSLILFDEPTTGLDPITAMQINELINKTKEELNATIIVVTHDIKSAFEVGDRLAFHQNGIIEHVATKEEFIKIDDPVLKEFFSNAMISFDNIKHSKHEETNHG
ncbi:MAG: ATP-binding cassette domain-containing protein [Parachlamydiales bacterium]|jgi:phospholipid/cholesterol/gamma-HCH transport system ATP-binding protein